MEAPVTSASELERVIVAHAMVAKDVLPLPAHGRSTLVCGWSAYAAVPLAVGIDIAGGRAGVGVVMPRGQVRDVPGLGQTGSSAADVAALVEEAEAWARKRLPARYVETIERAAATGASGAS